MRRPHLQLPPPTGGMNVAVRPTGITMALVVLILALGLMTIPDVVVGTVNGTVAAESGTFGGVSGLVSVYSFAIAAAVIWLWLRLKERRRFSTLGFERDKPILPRVLRGAAVGFGLMLVCVIVPVVTGQATLTWKAPEIGSDGLMFVLLMLLGFLVQGSTEEILLRGFITQAVARRWGLVAAVVVQSILFTLIHGANPGIGVLPLVNLMLFALFATSWTLAEGSLWGICAWHGVWNWSQGNFFGVPVSGNVVDSSILSYAPKPGSIDLITGGSFGIEGGLVATGVILAGTLIMWLRFRASIRATGSGPSAASSPSPSA